MKKNISIKVEGLKKKYEIGQKSFNPVFRDVILEMVSMPIKAFKRENKKKKSHIWALEDISFEVKKGEVVGVIGKNGAGKSTLLKVLSRITEPTGGLVKLKGRVGSLIEVGTGFHQELTGRENIYLNGAILGMKKEEVDEKFSKISKFSGIGKYLDTPVKRYSSGMYVRLAFSVAAHLDTEILLVDEVLSVGDVSFQKKSLGKVKDVAQSGRTVLFVSHNMNSISQLCSRCLVIKDGKIVFDGNPKAAISFYLSSEAEYFGERKYNKDRKKRMQIRRITVSNEGQKASAILDISQPIEVQIKYDVNEELSNAVVSCTIVSMDGSIVVKTEDRDLSPRSLKTRKSGRYCAYFEIPKDFINKGKYILLVECQVVSARERHSEMLDKQEVFQFECFDGKGRIKGEKPGVLAPVFRWATKRLKK